MSISLPPLRSNPDLASPIAATKLPSLHRLRLLGPGPSPSTLYPDTCPPSSKSQQLLLAWARHCGYLDSSHLRRRRDDRPHHTPLHVPPSVTIRNDPFQGLLNPLPHCITGNTQVQPPDPPKSPPRKTHSPAPSVGTTTLPVPMTPPMSPGTTSTIEPASTLESIQPCHSHWHSHSHSHSYSPPPLLTPSKSSQDILSFTPVVSTKLIQLVKAKRNEHQYTVSKKHKKTDSFKALQLKRLLDTRASISAPDLVPNKPLLRHEDATANSPSPSPSPSRSRSASPTRQFVMKLQNYSSPNASPTTSPRSSRSTSPSRQSHSHLHLHSHLHSHSPSPSHSQPQTIPEHATENVSETKEPPRPSRRHHRQCLSCRSTDSPCWRPSWSGLKTQQLCNSCGLRYKKTKTRCLNNDCRKIPTKSELIIMKNNGQVQETTNNTTITGYTCLFCNHITHTET
ncbi:hypothetical protein TBLA_0F01250 [Henningerozyma blattae CBS 6284]|uniref:GATA-type domain-containing protein n=1 Tax=Henningerozyma blattae (strain ATCC 34711 / CBS 6284 / DSM 70876 / NBRC 10599 / NRRL Y-10934 / UCD 77-7) TaxID=1071380 RepID=I2H5L6_HENB6|nr:hypothetical protein TBLA_0F01250 [Tetrapisispora blattae CBS 6284]CCH61668.1 hypothetical protein TBLA_0F01250 [Tetrapisispora blattae CBS 6284]